MWRRPPVIPLLILLTISIRPATLPAAAAPPLQEESVAAEEPAAETEESEWSVGEPGGEWTPVDIDTDETTWSNVDVRPDGSTIVFDMLGDIYTVPIGGGDATPLTEGIEWNFQPRYSPDGERIAFVSDRGGADNLWVMAADGSDPRAVTSETENLVHNPSWSPDGDYLVAKKGFTSTRSIPAGEIWLFHASGGKGLALVERPHGARDQKTLAEPAYSRDGRYVYYSQDTTPGRVWQYDKDSTGQIFVVKRLDTETGETEVVSSGPGGAIRPTPSPDGTHLAFVKRTPAFTSALYVKDLESGLERAVYDRLDRDLQETNGSQGNTPGFAWTPEGDALVFWAGGKIRRVDVASGDATVVPVRVTTTKKIQQALRYPVEVAPQTFGVRMLRWTQISPDGKKIVFQALGRLWVRDVATGAQVRLTGQSEHFEFYPSISRDGRWVAYTTWHDQDLGSLRVVSINGGEGRVVTPDPGHYVEPRFSPDGSRIAYRKLAGGFLLSPLWSTDPGLYVVDSDGGEPVRLSRSGTDPHFGAAADRLYYSASGEGTERLLKSVDLAGKDERVHAEGAEVTEFSVSPDGRWLAFTEQFDAWVTPFPATGRKIDVGREMTAVPVRQVSARSGEFLHWSHDSRRLHWSNGARLYSRALAEAFAFLEGSPEELPEPVTEGIDLGFEVETDQPIGTLALTGGRLVTMRDAERAREVIEPGVVVVEGDRIRAVGRVGEVDIPADAIVIDVGGRTVIPGLVDVHAHGGAARDEITPQQNWGHYANLAFGVTTTHDPSNDTSSIFSAAELQRTGGIVAPRLFSTGTILYGAHVPGATAVIDDYEDALFHVRRLKDVGAISVKSYNQPRRDQRQQVIAAGRELGVMVVPEGGAKFQHNMTMVVDGHTGIEHAMPLAGAYDDVRQLWSQTEVGYTPTFGVAYGGLAGENYWYDRTNVWENAHLMRYTPRKFVEPRAIRRSKAPDLHYNHIYVARFAKELRDRGVAVHIGAHGQLDGLAAHWEMWMMEQGGFTPWEALRAGTVDGARYLGLDGDIGSIETGKLADLAVIDGNPLDDLRQSERVVMTMLGGRLYDTATMHQIAPEPIERQPFYFELEGGDTIHPSTLQWLESFRSAQGWDHGNGRE